jgi:hypothetical protein
MEVIVGKLIKTACLCVMNAGAIFLTSCGEVTDAFGGLSIFAGQVKGTFELMSWKGRSNTK